jgi:hypothetical protein
VRKLLSMAELIPAMERALAAFSAGQVVQPVRQFVNVGTYVPSSTDDPADIDHAEIVRNAKAGRMMIVVATDEDSDLTKGWGLNPQGKMRPVAYTNPIYVDVDGDGYQANGDTLGHPLPVASESD